MFKFIIKPGLLAGTLVAVSGASVLAINLPARAQEAQTSPRTTTTTTNNSNATSGSSQAADHQAAAQTRLAAAKLKACQNREKAITNIMARISDRGQKQLDLFSTIAARTEAFYTDKGKTLSNYDALVSDVNAKQAAAQSAVSSTDSSGGGFSCDGSDPKGFVNSFKGSLKSEISALQAYRTSVKNLIVGVKSVEGTTSSTTNGGGQR